MLQESAIANLNDAPPLRIALFSGNYNYVVDGPVKALNRLVAHLEARGHEVLVFAPTIKTPAFRHSGTLISAPSVALPGKRSEYRLAVGLRSSARKALDRLQPDLIHLAAPDWLGYDALNYARAENIPAVASFHTRFDTYPRYYGAPWLEKYVTDYLRRFYGRCEHVYAPSHWMSDELKADGIGRDIRIWTRGVDGALFSPQKRDLVWRRGKGLLDDDIVIAFVGRVVLEKGIEVFAEAVQAATRSNPKIKALVVGEGPERPRFAQLLPEAVFMGYQQGEDLARAYASADIFFNPSITETFGNVTLEAMASGLPSVCAAASGTLSLVEDGRTGFLTPPEDGASGYCARLLELAASPALRSRMAQAARLKAEGFSWPTILDELVAHYRAAIAGYGRTSAMDPIRAPVRA